MDMTKTLKQMDKVYCDKADSYNSIFFDRKRIAYINKIKRDRWLWFWMGFGVGQILATIIFTV